MVINAFYFWVSVWLIILCGIHDYFCLSKKCNSGDEAEANKVIVKLLISKERAEERAGQFIKEGLVPKEMVVKFFVSLSARVFCLLKSCAKLIIV
jgi:hypothetical protein